VGVSWNQRLQELKARGDVICESSFRRRDGSTFFVETAFKYVPMEKNDCIIAISRDVTERKLADEIQKSLFVELEQANRDLKDFASVVSHDLKEPLRGAGTLANWLAQDYADKLDEEDSEKCGILMEQREHMNGLIEGVLRYSRASRSDEKEEKVDLNQMVREVIDTIAPPDNVEISLEKALPAIVCEPIRIMQVFQNLLSNAVKYIDKPRGRVKIDCAVEGDFWKFSISDNGPGIEEKYQKSIFKIFQTVPRTHGPESTGVGLAVAKKIVELYQGRMWVESQPPNGSTFFFTLPKKQTTVAEKVEIQASGVH
jgi:signal transduction histidine kinase